MVLMWGDLLEPNCRAWIQLAESNKPEQTAEQRVKPTRNLQRERQITGGEREDLVEALHNSSNALPQTYAHSGSTKRCAFLLHNR